MEKKKQSPKFAPHHHNLTGSTVILDHCGSEVQTQNEDFTAKHQNQKTQRQRQPVTYSRLTLLQHQKPWLSSLINL
ncbi:Uncharacterized protein HZ326_20780 [Fusarium oxysporum f. sp. albedinis]|nr:Uncharacterized protein HZ326_20780 [Fusarium oxysporum f. sp. albedinis]